jgi:integrase
MLDAAQRMELIISNPADNVELPKMEPKPIKVVMDSTQDAFLSAIKDSPYERIYLVGLHTGARISEILGITWNKVNLSTGEIKIDAQLQRPRTKDMPRVLVSTKTNNRRSVIVPPFMVDVFKVEKRQQSENKLKAGKMWDNSMNLVFTREDGSPMPHTTIENDFKRIARKIGRSDLSFHALRHTYATEEIASGTDPKTVADSLGHSTVAMTMNVYAAAVTETKIKAANRRQKQHEERENTASG